MLVDFEKKITKLEPSTDVATKMEGDPATTPRNKQYSTRGLKNNSRRTTLRPNDPMVTHNLRADCDLAGEIYPQTPPIALALIDHHPQLFGFQARRTHRSEVDKSSRR